MNGGEGGGGGCPEFELLIQISSHYSGNVVLVGILKNRVHLYFLPRKIYFTMQSPPPFLQMIMLPPSIFTPVPLVSKHLFRLPLFDVTALPPLPLLPLTFS